MIISLNNKENRGSFTETEVLAVSILVICQELF